MVTDFHKLHLEKNGIDFAFSCLIRKNAIDSNKDPLFSHVEDG